MVALFMAAVSSRIERQLWRREPTRLDDAVPHLGVGLLGGLLAALSLVPIGLVVAGLALPQAGLQGRWPPMWEISALAAAIGGSAGFVVGATASWVERRLQ